MKLIGAGAKFGICVPDFHYKIPFWFKFILTLFFHWCTRYSVVFCIICHICFKHTDSFVWLYDLLINICRKNSVGRSNANESTTKRNKFAKITSHWTSDFNNGFLFDSFSNRFDLYGFLAFYFTSFDNQRKFRAFCFFRIFIVRMATDERTRYEQLTQFEVVIWLLNE